MNGIDCIKDQSKFDALNEKALSYCLANGGIMERWCYPVIHPSTRSFVFIVEDRVLECLDNAERGNVFELEKNWFPESKIL